MTTVTTDERSERRQQIFEVRVTEVLQTIREIRKEHHACTARELERRCKMQHAICQRTLLTLREAGFVDWTVLPGSLHLTLKGGKRATR
jgi:DNA-binding IclR family transcriptional regulator